MVEDIPANMEWHINDVMQGDQAPGGAVTSDPSGSWGCGAYSGSQWFQLQWNDNLLNKLIAVKEMVPIIIAAAI